ncbi:Rne/Rng family ribonuclease [Anaplasmataceae bacterium AB001_6]|nr:Rne/Rng family ribonuclease [Anaplasmataceae bacterium AB001_6]
MLINKKKSDIIKKVRIIVDAEFKEESRIAKLDTDGQLIALEQSSSLNPSLKGYIFTGYISNVEPSLNAAFVECPDGRNGFLSFKELDERYINLRKNTRKRSDGSSSTNAISSGLKKGSKLIIQVVKDKRENKVLTLSTYISLPGRYCVLTTKRKEQVCKYITDEVERKRLHSLAEKLNKARKTGLFIKSSAQGKDENLIAADFKQLKKLWRKISEDANNSTKSTILYSEGSLAKKVVRDMYDESIKSIVVSDDNTYQEIKEYADIVLGKVVSSKIIKRYEEEQSIFHHYHIEEQIHTLYNSKVSLKSGGHIVINPTEALIAIDVNSGKMRREESMEETAYRINIEAAYEIAKQVELKNLSGLIVIDFIDMSEYNNRKEVEISVSKAFAKYQSDAVIADHLSDFGLMQISKRRVRNNIFELNTVACKKCSGKGRMISSNYVAVKILRAINNVVIKHNHDITACADENIIINLINTYKDKISEIEKKKKTKIILKISNELPEGGFIVESTASEKSIFVTDFEKKSRIEAPSEANKEPQNKISSENKKTTTKKIRENIKNSSKPKEKPKITAEDDRIPKEEIIEAVKEEKVAISQEETDEKNELSNEPSKIKRNRRSHSFKDKVGIIVKKIID